MTSSFINQAGLFERCGAHYFPGQGGKLIDMLRLLSSIWGCVAASFLRYIPKNKFFTILLKLDWTLPIKLREIKKIYLNFIPTLLSNRSKAKEEENEERVFGIS